MTGSIIDRTHDTVTLGEFRRVIPALRKNVPLVPKSFTAIHFNRFFTIT